MKFIHTADWQIGARFRQFGEKAEQLRMARLETVETILKLAADKRVDGLLVAGDLFEDAHVADDWLNGVTGLFERYSDVPVYILPGNHDPDTGPGSVWNRRPLDRPPAHVHVFREATPVAFAGGYLLPSPLHQKVSTRDPSLVIDELSGSIPPDAIRVGITHGAIAIPGKHQPNDFPISPDAATRARLDYLAVGHWHNWQVYDNDRLVMPGTPEPDGFDRAGAGRVALVEIGGRGTPPKIEPCSVATLNWHAEEVDLLTLDSSKAALEQKLATLRELSERSVIRVTITGSAACAEQAGVQSWLAEQLGSFPVSRVDDRSSTAFTELEQQQIRDDHPVLGQVLSDLVHLEQLASGQSTAGADESGARFSLNDIEHLLNQAGLSLSDLTPRRIDRTRQLFLNTLRDIPS